MVAITIPDEERAILYAPSVPTTAFPVPFPIYDLADLAVYVDDVLLDPGDYVVSGVLADQAYSNATVTLDTAVQGVDVEIIGAFVPIRTSQFVEGNRIPTRDLNNAFNRLTIAAREIWDRFIRIGPIDQLPGLVADAQAAANEAESFSKRNVIPIAGVTHTFGLDDINAIVDFLQSSPSFGTIPPNSSVVWAIGDQIDVRCGGTGLVTFVAGAGVTINSPHGYLNIPTQFAMATLIYMGSNIWQLTGGLG